MNYFTGIDPSTKTGIVTLDESGKVILEHEIKSPFKEDPARMIYIANSAKQLIPPNTKAFVCIEGFSFNSVSQRADFQYGLGWLIRSMLFTRKLEYDVIPPSEVKSFAGARTHTGEKGNKKRIKGPEVKKEMARAVLEKFGYTHKSDNVIDAYVLARMALQKYGGAK
jgi:crossover junction endodeoxyribonuclease RuvC